MGKGINIVSCESAKQLTFKSHLFATAFKLSTLFSQSSNKWSVRYHLAEKESVIELIQPVAIYYLADQRPSVNILGQNEPTNQPLSQCIYKVDFREADKPVLEFELFESPLSQIIIRQQFLFFVAVGAANRQVYEERIY